jgi:inosine-uridine nucleoside N-ribohydrolase
MILPILLIGIVIGARRGWPLWSLWWLGWTFFVTTLSILLWLHGTSRPAIIYFLWELLPIAILLSIGVAIWQRSDGFKAAFTMFPCILEITRFVLFDDLPVNAQFLLMRAVTLLIYGSLVIFLTAQRSHRARWISLILGTLSHFLIALIISWPIAFIFVSYPSYFWVVISLAFTFLIIGWGLDGSQLCHRLAIPSRIALLATSGLLIIGPSLPWLTGNALPAPSYAPVVAQTSNPRQPIIIDTDLSHDDCIAILYLLQNPKVDVLGITVANGIAHVEPGLENVYRLLSLADRTDIPVAAGAPSPLAGDNTYPEHLRHIIDFGLRPALPKTQMLKSEHTASDLIQRLSDESPTPAALIALGPLTNIAQVLQKNPDQAARFSTIFVSGGIIGEYDDVIDTSNRDLLSDWNLLLDPQAADLVLNSGIPIKIIPLDITNPYGPNSILVNRNLASQIETNARGRESQIMARIMRGWLFAFPGVSAVPLWDTVVATIVTEPTICTEWHDLSIRVNLEPGEFEGEIIVDENGQPNARVCLAGDQTAFEEIYLSTAH